MNTKKRNEYKRMGLRGRWKRGIGKGRTGKRGTKKRRTLKLWKALQFSKAKATEQRSRQFTAKIRLMIVRESHNRISLPSAWQWKRRHTWQTQSPFIAIVLLCIWYAVSDIFFEVYRDIWQHLLIFNGKDHWSHHSFNLLITDWRFFWSSSDVIMLYTFASSA